MDAIIETRGISKRFGGVQALSDVSVTIARGSIHAFVGENGAGKSTLGRVIAGAIRPDKGECLVDGKPVRYSAPHQALRDGIASIAQEIMLVPARTVIENVFLGNEGGTAVVRSAALSSRYQELSDRLGFQLDPVARVSSLSVGEKKKVEIMRAVARDARLVVMDEPTAPLSSEETQTFLSIVEDLRQQGKTIIFVSHFLDEVLRVADTVTVLRNGQHVSTSDTASETAESLVEAMLGRPLTAAFPPKRVPPRDARIVCSVDRLARKGAFRDVTFEVLEGEIVGLAGLVGSGRTEIARALFGADPVDRGTVHLRGRPLAIRSPRDAVAAGVAMLPESRKDQGLMMRSPVKDNVTVANLDDISRGGLISSRREVRQVQKLLDELSVTPANPSLRVAQLSGGNQQKVLFAKWLFRRPLLLIADEPTRGVDIGAKRAIYDLLAELATEGLGILLISSEIEEILGLAHRVLVMRRGEIVASFAGEEVTEEQIMHAAFATAAPSMGARA